MVGVGSCAGCPLAGPWGGRLGPGGCYQAACRAELWFPAVAGGGGRCGTGGVVSLLLTHLEQGGWLVPPRPGMGLWNGQRYC